MRRRPIRERGHPATFTQPVMNPFIDIVFLILVYFIMTYVAQDIQAGFDVNMPSKAPPPIDQEHVPTLQILVAADGFYVQGTKVDKARLENALKRLAILDKNQMIVITSKQKATHQQLVDVLDICAKVELEKVAVASAKD